ncbi:MAG: MBL fold metallo-hydrolase [Acidobacteriota bacterium]
MRFRNPPGSPPQIASPADFVPFFLRRALDRPPPVPAGHVIPLAEAKAMLAAAGPESLTWLGHACFLIRTGGFSILTDPFLSDYASPVAGLGPKRYVPPGISLEGLPKIDAIVISHNHYDHLDERSVREISSKGRGKTAALVPAGLGSFFTSRGYSDVRELGWGDRTLLRKSSSSSSFASSFPVALSCLPCIHFSGRTPFDRNRSLWASWSIVSPSLSLFFAGDTGYGPVFAETGRQYGPFDVALVPIGAYQPPSIMRAVHCDPEEAVALGRDVRASTLVAMHWGTIVLTDEPPFEPPGRFRAAANRAGYHADRTWVMSVGETRATRS